MSEHRPDDDQDPEPLKDFPAERVGNESGDPQEIEDDPSQSPDDPELRDVKGG